MDDDKSLMPHRIVAGILVDGDRVLLCHRSANKQWFPNVWDLPGGHIEVGETPQQALVRELHEELAINMVTPPEKCLARITTNEFDMLVWRITNWTGIPVNAAPLEHNEIAWFALPETEKIELGDASYPELLETALLLD